MSEKELIQGCRQGDQACQFELFRLYAGKLLTLCRRYARNQMEAEDWLQDSFVLIFEKLHQFRDEGSLEGWMRRIVVNTALQALRKAKLEMGPSLDTGADSDFIVVEPDALSKLEVEDILDLISEMPDGYRVIFNLYAIEGFSHKEIAEMLQIEESTSRSQLTKARKYLQKLFSDRQKKSYEPGRSI